MSRKLKRLMPLILLVLMATLLAGCSGSAPDSAANSDEPAAEAATDEASDSAGDAATDAVPGAVPFGEWLDIEQPVSGENYPCKARIVKVLRDQKEVQARIDAYNVDGSRTIEPLEGKDKDLTEYIIIEYEVQFPDDYPTVNFGNKGIANPDISFDAKKNDGEGFVASDGTYYVGMGMNIELGKPSDDELPLPGGTFKGAILLQMLKGFDDFHLDHMYKSGDSEEYGHVQFAIK
ncbi:MAG: hypothetical protein LBD12_06765 [Clostridiales Family XIII bacterium]|jgi:hypothetical protein|nr:hypothetical protein [Clostridiales Family XIII bacterium]